MLCALAESPEIGCVRREELIGRLGLFAPPADVERDSRAMPGEVESAHAAGLKKEKLVAIDRLTSILADLRRNLRKQVKGPTRKT